MKDNNLQLLLLDNYDSFTYNLYDYLSILNTRCTVIRNDKITVESLKSRHFDGIVLSPGPKRPADAGILMDVLDYYSDKKPILGICLGMQAIGEYFGAKLVHAKIPIHGKTSLMHHTQTSIFEGISTPTLVMRYHSLVLESLPTCLVPLGHTPERELMGLKHNSLPITGLQFHPESILTKNGFQMLSNWVKTIPQRT
jgi:anthranilate synthase/aminodeoxychorismate synthase-like glutamine amidotransferase